MARHTYYGFKLEDAVRGLKRALRDEDIVVLCVRSDGDRVTFKIEIPVEKSSGISFDESSEIASETGEIGLAYHTTKTHPLARLGEISAIEVTVDDHLPNVKPVLTMAFLRGGG